MKPAWLNSLSLKLLLAYLVGVVLSLVLIALTAVAVTTFRSDQVLDKDIAERTEELAELLRFDRAGIPIGFDASEDDIAWIYQSLQQEVAYRVLDAAGNVVLFSDAGAAFWMSNGAIRPFEPGRFEFERDGVRIHGATEPIPNAGRTWFLQFAVSTRLMDLMYQKIALPFVGAGIALFTLVLLFVFGLCAWVTLGFTLIPLRELSASAAAIAPRSLHARLQLAGVPSEIAPLVDSFNRTLERLERGYRVQQEFLATAAHELKTPLALIRAQLELGSEGAERESLLRDVSHMTRQVQQLLLLAEASEVQNYDFDMVDMTDVMMEAVTYLHRMAQAAGVHLTTRGKTMGDPWRADRGALFTMLKNLLENAIQHAPRGTEVIVEVDTTTLSVRDRGPGVDQERLSKIFVRFWRGAHRRDHGAGLGLAICREIALAHGWTLCARRAEPGLQFLLSRSAGERPERPT